MLKILENYASMLKNVYKKICKDLLEGDMLKAESRVQAVTQSLNEALMTKSLNEVGTSMAFKDKLKAHYSKQPLKKLSLRATRVQLSTGVWVSYKSYYAKEVGSAFSLGRRHLSHCYWGTIKGASLKYASLVSSYGIMSPSFEVGCRLLDLQGVEMNKSRLRSLSIAYGALGLAQGEESTFFKEESLKGHRVIISFDGGRIRMREENGAQTQKGKAKYDTPWREPKIMLIGILNKKGELDRQHQIPLYMGTMSATKTAMDKLKRILSALNIEQAQQIQFIADGATSIWKGIRRVFRQLKVSFSKIIFTLDYYHAVEHLSELSKLLPDEVSKQKVVFKTWKDLLWNGRARSIVRDFKKRIKRLKVDLSQEMQTALNYFFKHHDHMQYQKYRRRKLLCGSGLIESAVRRIVNLRFKGSSSFWKKQNLEKLIFLRCTFLANRWNNFLNNCKLYLFKLGTI